MSMVQDLLTTPKLAKEIRKMRCSNCMRLWKQQGKPAESMPRLLRADELADGRCPDCREAFRSYMPF